MATSCETCSRLRAKLKAAEDVISELRSGLDVDDARVATARFRARFGLSPTEARTVLLLARRPGEVVGKARIYDVIHRGGDLPPSPAVLNVNIHRIRRKMAAHGVTIRNEYGVGYRLEDPAACISACVAEAPA